MIQVYYLMEGEGFPLAMIMRLSANVDWWNIDPHWIQDLSKRFKLVMFDNRGAGRTDISDKRYTIKLLADDTAGLLNVLGISKAHVLGISMGGMTAQELVLNYPDKVEKLVLCSSYCGGTESVLPSREILEILAADRSTLSPEEIVRTAILLFFAADFIKKNLDVVERAIQQVPKAPISNEAFRRQLNAVGEFDTYDRLSQIRVSTLILHGKHDILVPPENGSILAEAIPNAEVVCLENSAHGLMEETEKVLPVILNFLAE